MWSDSGNVMDIFTKNLDHDYLARCLLLTSGEHVWVLLVQYTSHHIVNLKKLGIANVELSEFCSQTNINHIILIYHMSSFSITSIIMINLIAIWSIS